MSEQNTTQATDEATTEEASTVTTQGGLDVGTMFMASIMAAIIVLAALNGFKDQIRDYMMPPSGSPAKVLVVDSQKILTDYMKSLMENGIGDVTNTAQTAAQFTTELQNILSKYTNKGYVVLPATAVLSSPDSRDITEHVENDLKLWMTENQGQNDG